MDINDCRINFVSLEKMINELRLHVALLTNFFLVTMTNLLSLQDPKSPWRHSFFCTRSSGFEELALYLSMNLCWMFMETLPFQLAFIFLSYDLLLSVNSIDSLQQTASVRSFIAQLMLNKFWLWDTRACLWSARRCEYKLYIERLKWSVSDGCLWIQNKMRYLHSTSSIGGKVPHFTQIMGKSTLSGLTDLQEQAIWNDFLTDVTHNQLISKKIAIYDDFLTNVTHN